MTIVNCPNCQAEIRATVTPERVFGTCPHCRHLYSSTNNPEAEEVPTGKAPEDEAGYILFLNFIGTRYNRTAFEARVAELESKGYSIQSDGQEWDERHGGWLRYYSVITG